jgi:hypothetical protein
MTGERITRLILAVALAIQIGACSTAETPTIGGHVRPNENLLETTLVIGVSTKARVKEVLGEPGGPGGIYLPIDPKPRESWTYNYEKASIGKSKPGRISLNSIRTYLFIYFDKDIYDGYMWFSSVPKHSGES